MSKKSTITELEKTFFSYHQHQSGKTKQLATNILLDVAGLNSLYFKFKVQVNILHRQLLTESTSKMANLDLSGLIAESTPLGISTRNPVTSQGSITHQQPEGEPAFFC
jgi:hypothetical protein